MANQLVKRTTTIPKGQREGAPVYTGGARVRFIALPVRPDGTVALDSPSLSFKACVSSGPYHTIVDYEGKPLQIKTRVSQGIGHIPNFLDAAPAMLPIKDGELFVGLQVIVPISSFAESEDRVIDVFCE